MSESACVVDCPEVCPLVPAHTPSFSSASLSAERQEVSVEEVFSEIHAELVTEALKDLDADAEMDSSAATLVGDLLDAFVVDAGIQAARICRFRRGKTLTREDLDFCLSRNFAVPSTSDSPVSSVVSSTVSGVSSRVSSVYGDTGGWRPLALASPLSSFAWGRQRRPEGDPSKSLRALVSRQQETHTRLFQQILLEQKEGISGGLSRGEGGRKIRIRTLVSQKGSAQKGMTSEAPGDREEKKRVRGAECSEVGEDSRCRTSASPQGGEGESAETGVSAKKSCVASDGGADAAPASSVSTDVRPSGEEQTEGRGGRGTFVASAGGGETPVSGDRAEAVGCRESREGICEERERQKWDASSCGSAISGNASLQDAYFGNAPGPQDGQQMDLNRHPGRTEPSASAALAHAPPSLSQSPSSLHTFAEAAAELSNPKPSGFVADVSPVCAQGGDSTQHSSGVPVSRNVSSVPLHGRDLPRPAAEGLVSLPVDYSQPYPSLPSSLPSSLPPFASPYFPAGLAYPPVAQGASVTPHDSHFFASGGFLASPLAPFRHPRRQQGHEGEELAAREAQKI